MTDRAGPAAESRVYGLDILRALAVLFVVYSHGAYLIPDQDARALYNRFIADGVSIFFVLSGFLIGGILLRMIEAGRCGAADLANFWTRRWLRTLPCYYAVLAVVAAMQLAAGSVLPPQAWKYLLFAQNLLGPHPGFFNEAWSLSVEEWFYLGVPPLLFGLARVARLPRRGAIAMAIVALIAGVTLARIDACERIAAPGSPVSVAAWAAWDEGVRKVVVMRLDGIMFGLLGAYLAAYHASAWRRAAGPAFVAGIAVLASDQIGLFYTEANLPYVLQFRFTIVSIGTLLLIPRLASLASGAGPLYRALSYISAISYPIYLVNYSLVLGGLLPLLTRGLGLDAAAGASTALATYAGFWALTLACAAALHRLVERPFMRLRDKVAPAR